MREQQMMRQKMELAYKTGDRWVGGAAGWAVGPSFTLRRCDVHVSIGTQPPMRLPTHAAPHPTHPLPSRATAEKLQKLLEPTDIAEIGKVKRAPATGT